VDLEHGKDSVAGAVRLRGSGTRCLAGSVCFGQTRCVLCTRILQLDSSNGQLRRK
jgi:hypothetical protein